MVIFYKIWKKYNGLIRYGKAQEYGKVQKIKWT